MFSRVSRGWVCTAVLAGAFLTAACGCAGQPQATQAPEEVPEGYPSWEAYGEAEDLRQKDFENDMKRYRMQMHRDRSGPMRR
jgi:hypothetical protein